MAELIFYTGPMDCGKSTLALQIDYTESSAGRRGVRFTSRDRAGEAVISSRIGLAQPAVEVTPDLDFWTFVVAEFAAVKSIGRAEALQRVTGALDERKAARRQG